VNRTECPECGKLVHVRKDGLLRMHNRTSVYYAVGSTALRCDGSGMRAAVVEYRRTEV
jgi:hypothetical protein